MISNSSIFLSMPMHSRYLFSAIKLLLFIFAASESVFNITFVTAVFPFGVSVGGEGLAAFFADKMIGRLSAEPLGMRFPPSDPASRRAEYPALHSRRLHQGSATFTAYVRIRLRRLQVVPAAEGYHRRSGNIQSVSYLRITQTLQTKIGYFFFLLICHVCSSIL